MKAKPVPRRTMLNPGTTTHHQAPYSAAELSCARANIAPQLFANLATPARVYVPASINYYNIRPAFDVYAGPTGGRDR